MIKHHHFIGRFEVAKPPLEEDRAYLVEWMATLIRDQGMKVLSGPHVAFVDTPGNRGLTGVAIIETSHVAIHIWDEGNPALIQLDFYTCGTLDKDAILRAVKPWGIVRSQFLVLDREDDVRPLEAA
ncbi:MAG: S-adenosylmethionine decarboxylase [Hyphomicrobium sp.]|nr:S-adenosylmethionine decarboxylase [Hyphomicrobium sp.]